MAALNVHLNGIPVGAPDGREWANGDCAGAVAFFPEEVAFEQEGVKFRVLSDDEAGKILIFNFLVGNGDAHGKNFSVLYRGRTVRLAPAYDLMSTAIYPEVGKRMAMKIDGEYGFKWITRSKFLRLGKACGIGAKVIERELDRMVRVLPRQANALAARCNREHPSTCYDKIVAGILTRTAQIAVR